MHRDIHIGNHNRKSCELGVNVLLLQVGRRRILRSHGMGIDTAGNIYAGLNKMARVDKYVRMH